MKVDDMYPSISVIVPVYNGQKTIQLCLESLVALQYPNEKLQIIVVDNRSMDRTVEIVKMFGVQLIQEKEIQSSYAARNKGIKNSNGEIIAFTDADCVVDKRWLYEIVNGYQDRSIGCFVGEIHAFPQNSPVAQYLGKMGALSQKKSLSAVPLPYAVTANIAYRKQVFDRIGFFDDTLKSGGDLDYFWRMKLQTEFQTKYNPDAIVYHIYQETVLGLYKQYFRYGQGASHLRKNYASHYKKFRSLKTRTFLKRIFTTLINIIFVILPITIINLFSKNHTTFLKNRGKIYDLIRDVGFRLGLTLESLRYWFVVKRGRVIR